MTSMRKSRTISAICFHVRHWHRRYHWMSMVAINMIAFSISLNIADVFIDDLPQRICGLGGLYVKTSGNSDGCMTLMELGTHLELA